MPTASFVRVENQTRFNCYTKLATRFRSGRVFLAGDSAHLCSPAEGHGMNTGIQDAFNLAWKLALVQRGGADANLLNSYEAERRPVAETITQSGDVFEQAQTLTDSAERDKRDQAIRAMLRNPEDLHHQVMSETELVIDYSRSPIVTGNSSDEPAPGFRLPEMITVQWPAGVSRELHQLAHREGHTLMLLGGPAADPEVFANLHASVREFVADSALFEAVVALDSQTKSSVHIGQLEPRAADRLGVKNITLLAVRPDGYVGLRCDTDHHNELQLYSLLFHTRVGE